MKAKQAQGFKNYKKGLVAETIASFYLILTGHKIIKKRYRSHSGEIDIIASRSNIILFVEVKKRKNTMHDCPIGETQKKRITKAASSFIQKNRRFNNYAIRFDAIIITTKGLIKHIKQAWQPNE